MDLKPNNQKPISIQEKITRLLEQYARLKKDNLWFYYDYYEPGSRAVEVYLKGKNYILFSTNNYLGLAKNPIIINAAIEVAKKYGIGTGASFAITGGTIYHKKLEEALKKFYNYEDGIVFSSGYMANSAVITALAEENMKVFCDKYIHISFSKALKMNNIENIKFEHNNVNDLYNKIRYEYSLNKTMKSLVITESLFSQQGDIAKVRCISQIAKEFKSTLIVDDAHGLGTIGKQGRGILEYSGLNSHSIPILTGAMNKSLGSNGGYILSTKKIANLIRMKAHELIFTSSLPAFSMAAALAALHEIETNKTLIKKLKNNILYFREGLRKLKLVMPEEITPIIPIIIGSTDKTCRLSSLLKKKGIIAIPIIPPAVPDDASRVRFQITTDHSYHDIDKLLSTLKIFFKNEKTEK